MKIFNYENGKRVVYVQMNEFGRLMHAEEVSIPSSVFENIYSNILIIDDRNRYTFKRFDDENAVKFFEEQDWIIDYKKVRDFSEEHFLAMAEDINQEMQKVANKYNSMSEQVKSKNYKLRCRFDMLEHKFYSLRDVLWFKQGHLKMDIPVVPDSDVPTSYSNDSKYQAFVGLNPQQLLISKTNGEVYDRKEQCPLDFYTTALNQLIKMNQDNNEFFNEFKKLDGFSEDGQYQITTLSIVVPEVEKEIKCENPKKKESALVTLVKRILKK